MVSFFFDERSIFYEKKNIKGDGWRERKNASNNDMGNADASNNDASEMDESERDARDESDERWEMREWDGNMSSRNRVTEKYEWW